MILSKGKDITYQKIGLSTICFNYLKLLTICIEMEYFIGISNLRIFFLAMMWLNWLILDRVEVFIPNNLILSIFLPGGIGRLNVCWLMAIMVIKWTYGVLAASCSKLYRYFHYFPAMMKSTKSIGSITLWARQAKKYYKTFKNLQPIWNLTFLKKKAQVY